MRSVFTEGQRRALHEVGASCLVETRMPDLSRVVVTPEIEEIESIWAGGIADFGDPRAARAIVHAPGYKAYLRSLKQELRRGVGAKWVMYRAMPADVAEDMQEGGGHGAKGYTFRRAVAEGWKRFAAHKAGEEIVVVRAMVEPDAVVMRGKEAEAELVLDTHWDPYHLSLPLHKGKLR